MAKPTAKTTAAGQPLPPPDTTASATSSSSQRATDVAAILKHYDTDGDGKLNGAELVKLKAEYKAKTSPVTEYIRRSYDLNNDGHLDEGELGLLYKDMDSTDTGIRYGGYLAAMARAVRYAAYTSDLGEAFRPIVHPYFVTGAYGVSWAYVVGDVCYEGYQARNHHGLGGSDLGSVITKRAVFQSVASMILPAITIHSTVKYSKRWLFKPHLPQYVKWGPTFAGLGVIPFLPVMWDEPVEFVCDKLFDTLWPVKDAAYLKATQHHHH